MLKVKSNGTINMSRGDSISLTINLSDSDGNEYILQEGDRLFFSAKKKATDESYAISPILLTGEKGTTLHLDASDTYDLEFGTYLYDIQLVTANGKTNTVIKPTQLIIEEAITAYGDR